MSPKLARQAVVDQLVANGVEYVFGNPGTVEQGLLDALEQTTGAPKYVLGLHEGAVVGMADGYARGSGRPAVVQLHSGVGLGNGIGMLYQALRGRTPMVVLAGEAGLAADALDGQMAADLVAMATPVTKWAARAVHPDSVLRLVRRAFKVACTAPCGPVFLSLPMDVLDAETNEEVVPGPVIDTDVVPPGNRLEEVADILLNAERPLIVAGDEVSSTGGQAGLAALAEATGADVRGADWSEVNLDQTHPLYGGQLGHMFGSASQPVTAGADAVLIVGTSFLPEVFPALDGVFAPGARTVHLGLDPWEIAKNFPVDLALLGSSGPTLLRLAGVVRERATQEQQDAAARRVQELTDAHRAAREEALAQDRQASDERRVTVAGVAAEVAGRLGDKAVVFDEALTLSPEVARHLTGSRPGTSFLTRGGSLGVGIPGAVGLKLARPDEPVVGFTGDGGSMYTIQALWTAARYGIDVTVFVCNNGKYQILRDNMDSWWQEQEIPAHDYPVSFELDPPIRFAELAASLGASGFTIYSTKDIEPVVETALARPGPSLVEIRVGAEPCPST